MSDSHAVLAEVYRVLREIGRRHLAAAEQKQTPAPEACRPTGSGREGDSPHGGTAPHASRA